jgi:hypothetical protein
MMPAIAVVLVILGVFVLVSIPQHKTRPNVKRSKPPAQTSGVRIVVSKLRRRWFRSRKHLDSRVEFHGASSGDRPWGPLRGK